ncbi:MAG TPA: hypothetical protein VK141_04190 [Nitrosomonas sp.]|nr:hypothetical protein [Nitrosomonas sp.]
MDTNILIAIIGMLAAVITSIVSLIAALLVTKRTAKADQNLERLRLDQEQVKLLLGIKNETFEESLKALEEGCVLIQKTRDEIRTCLPKIEHGCKEKDIKLPMDSCDNLVSFFQNKHYQLIPEHRERFHELKNLTGGARIQLENAIHRNSPNKTRNIIGELTDYVDSLGKAQTSFLAFRDKMIATLGTTSIKKED